MHLKDLAKGLANLNKKEVIFDLPDEEESKGFSTASQAVLDSVKIESIGWKPLFDLNEALKKTVELIRNERV